MTAPQTPSVAHRRRRRTARVDEIAGSGHVADAPPSRCCLDERLPGLRGGRPAVRLHEAGGDPRRRGPGLLGPAVLAGDRPALPPAASPPKTKFDVQPATADRLARIHEILGRALSIWAFALSFFLPVVALVLGLVALGQRRGRGVQQPAVDHADRRQRRPRRGRGSRAAPRRGWIRDVRIDRPPGCGNASRNIYVSA